MRANDRLVEVNGRPVTEPADVQAAWRDPQDGRVRVVLLRGEQELRLDEPLPTVLGYEVAAAPWRAHLAGGVALADDAAIGDD